METKMNMIKKCDEELKNKTWKVVWVDKETHVKLKTKASEKGLSLKKYVEGLVSDE